MSKSAVIAIVDDDQTIREALSELLQVEGLSSQTFDSAGAFLAAAQTRTFDVLVTDFEMPGTDGLQLQRHLRARGLAVPVIFVSASLDEAARDRALRDGALRWFAKPVSDTLFLHAIRALLGRTPA